MVEHFRSHGAELDFNVQLNTDLTAMPIEDGRVEWPESASPYRRVARIVIPAQDAFDPRLQDAIDYDVSFSPAHGLLAHRPLGGITRARLSVYPRVSSARRSEDGRANGEPSSLEELTAKP